MNKFTGKWLIEEMEMWDRDFIDLVERGHFIFDSKGGGSFVFGAVTGCVDYKIDKGQLEFTFEGEDECDPTSGRGYVKLSESNKLKGQIYFHQGDDSSFTLILDDK